jgi:Flp pilus assembly protein TadD
MPNYTETCFVVMPFGQKKMGRRTIDFDSIYTTIFSPAIENAVLPGGGKIKGRRTDKDFFTGDITTEMFRYLEYSRFVLCDITGLNPNVFYELGIRHRARQSGTAIFRQVDVKLPFDISHIKAFPYEFKPEKSAEQSRQLVTQVLTESLREDRTDNIVRVALQHEQQNPRPDVEVLLKDAENALRNEDRAGAINFLRQAVRANPTNAMSHVKLGILLKEYGGNWNEALEHFNAAVQAASNYADAYREKGIAEGKLNQSVEAERSLRKAIELNPTDFDALAGLGGILKRKDELQAALLKYRESARVSNGHSYPLLNALSIEAHLRGSLDLSADKISLFRAERSLRLQVQDDPPYNAPWSFFDLAQIRLFQSDREGFLEYVDQGLLFCGAAWMPQTFRETLELIPKDPKTFPGLDEGIQILKKAEIQLTGAKPAQ